MCNEQITAALATVKPSESMLLKRRSTKLMYIMTPAENESMWPSLMNEGSPDHKIARPPMPVATPESVVRTSARYLWSPERAAISAIVSPISLLFSLLFFF